MSGKLALWLAYFYVRIFPMSYLRLRSFIYVDIYIYIYISSVRASSRVRPVVAVVVLCQSVRPVDRPVVVVPSSSSSVPSCPVDAVFVLCPSVRSVVVCPLSARPRQSVVVVRPLSVLCPSGEHAGKVTKQNETSQFFETNKQSS